ncbi:MAG: DUF4834 family protein [Bacteroidaceae bacterium]|nr:DUF4834 family protein [Bacteroidaceae bacterium]
MSFLIFIIIFALLAFIFMTSVAVSVMRWFLSLFGRNDNHTSTGGNATHDGQRRSNTQWSRSGSSNTQKEKKILFGKDEGEYVDFEEIKDEES